MKEIVKSLENQMGIYCIINIVNQKRYIGSSKNLRNRLWKHRSLLRNNKHENVKLQNSWNKYTEKNFDYYIIEYCQSLDDLQIREQFYIDTLKPELNITKIVERNILSKESRIKQSETRKRLFNENKLQPNHCRKIYQYDLNGNFLNEFRSVRQASKQTNTTLSSIYRYLNGKYKKGGKYLWSYEKVNVLPHYIKRDYSLLKKPIKILDTLTQQEYVIPSIKESAQFLQVSVPTIKMALKDHHLIHKQYMVYFNTVV